MYPIYYGLIALMLIEAASILMLMRFSRDFTMWLKLYGRKFLIRQAILIGVGLGLYYFTIWLSRIITAWLGVSPIIHLVYNTSPGLLTILNNYTTCIPQFVNATNSLGSPYRPTPGFTYDVLFLSILIFRVSFWYWLLGSWGLYLVFVSLMVSDKTLKLGFILSTYYLILNIFMPIALGIMTFAG